MDNNKRTPRIVSNLIWRQVDENTVVVSPRSGEMRVLNEVGSTIWRLMDGRNTPENIVERLVADYNIPPEQAQNDLQAFLADLDERQLLEWVER